MPTSQSRCTKSSTVGETKSECGWLIVGSVELNEGVNIQYSSVWFQLPKGRSGIKQLSIFDQFDKNVDAGAREGIMQNY